MDGEGTVTIKRYKRGKNGWLGYQSWITCAQVDKPRNVIALKRLHHLFGGGFTKWRNKGFRLDTVTWCVVSQKARRCAIQLLPFLIIKKPQAKILIQFTSRQKGKAGYRLTPKDRKDYANFWKRMRKLNVKGKLRLQRLSEEAPQNGDAIV